MWITRERERERERESFAKDVSTPTIKKGNAQTSLHGPCHLLDERQLHSFHRTNERHVRYLGIHLDRMLTYRQHVEPTALKCKKGLSVLKAMAAKGVEHRHLFLLYCIKVWCSVPLATD